MLMGRIICFFVLSGILHGLQANYHINIIGFLHDAKSLSRHTSSIIDCLHQEKDLTLKLFKEQECSERDLAPQCAAVLRQAVDVSNYAQRADFIKKGCLISGAVVYANPLCQDLDQFDALLSKNIIRIGSLVWETTQILPRKVADINAHCDAIVVPDPWLVDVYKSSGVTCPIFVLPLALDLNSLLARPIKNKRNDTFTFGFSGLFALNGRKNHEGLLQAFIATFGDDVRVHLKLHGRCGKLLQQLGAKNVSIESKGFDRQSYEEFLASLDCYVTVAKGEGFSIIPREVLALGIPCIVANNTAQQTICNSGFVRPVPSNIIETLPVLAGNWFNTDPKDTGEAMVDVYQNYDYYVKLVKQGRTWVKQYLAENLTKKYRSLFFPKMVVFGDCDELTDDYLMTSSLAFYTKCQRWFRSPKMRFVAL